MIEFIFFDVLKQKLVTNNWRDDISQSTNEKQRYIHIKMYSIYGRATFVPKSMNLRLENNSRFSLARESISANLDKIQVSIN